jgi:hypothetical protein
MKSLILRRLIPGLLILAALHPGVARAQEQPPLDLKLIRTFGYGGFNEIEGNFKMRIANPPPLERVEFKIDDEIVYTATQVPFEYSFKTEDFPPGIHTMSALGYTSGGDVLASNSITTNFLSGEESQQRTIGLVGPILLLLVGVTAISWLVTRFVGRRRGYIFGQYGSAGGAICPRCGKPYSRHFLSPNLGAGKLERCPHCGKLAIVRQASRDELEKAEALLAGDSTSIDSPGTTDEERLRRMLDDSRYED